MTIDDIKALIAAGESRTLEQKKSTGELKDGMHAACAFLNTDGGWLILGVTPKSTKIIAKSSFSDWLTNKILWAELNQDFFFLLATNGYPPQWSDEVFDQVLDQVENFKENSSTSPRTYDFPYPDNTSVAAEP